ncbi:PAS domain S-box protein [Opitutus sp. GAS368]|uniref:PAS domain S-box protein n=1 Tax=Opitutus sp. GAS368 TaxID=1882749 RepID=UPI00087D05E7|nr:PAS domain S-box protein [Opitutus sp. GAS368]SDS43136.1 PAS domain S-box-containing protein [Opitutus sp. GAS368]
MKKEINVLIIEDVPADVVIINHELRRGGLSFRSKRVGTKEEFLEELRSGPPDLILSDHGLPQFDGFSALAIAQNQCPEVPFLFVTGSMGEEVAIESLKSGATDYVLKNRLTGLVPAVTRALRLAEERRKRVEAEHALGLSEEHFRNLVEGVRDYAIFMLDTAGNITTWNTGAEWIMGYPAAEIVGRSHECMFLASDVAAGQPGKLLRLAENKGRSEREGWRLRKGGARFWANTVVSTLRNPEGGLRGFAVITRDITTHKEVEAVLARLAAIVQGSDDAIISKTLEGIITSWNHGAEKIFGYTAEEAVGRSIVMLLPPERSEEELSTLSKLARGEKVEHFETVRVTKDGRRIDVSEGISPIKDDTGRVIGAAKIARDITQQKLAQEQLRRAEARNTAILQAALDAVITIDRESIVHDWNTAAERMFGYPRAEAIGRNVDALIIPSTLLQVYRDGLAQYLILGAGSLIGRPIELTARRANGAELAIELGITPIAASEPPLYTAIIRDISARKETEAEIRRLNVELEQRVRARTAELEAANQELESFSYSVSHDLRAPLRHITGFIEMLQARAAPALDEESQRLARSIADSAARMTRLIDALLGFSRLGRADLRKIRVSLAALVRGAQRELRSEMHDRKIEWISGPLPDVDGDPALLQQVLINLLANALKYTRPREVARIEVGAKADAREVVCFVRDNGVGFDMRYADKLFGVFQRLHHPSEFEGTGIGLANVRLIVHRHGGRSWAEGTVNEGATFFFSLPVAAAPVP